MAPLSGETVDARVARRLRQARLAAGLTVREAARAVGASDHSLIVRYENGTVRPGLERLAALAKLYGLTLAALLAVDDALVPVIGAVERAADDPQALALLLAALAPLLERGTD